MHLLAVSRKKMIMTLEAHGPLARLAQAEATPYAGRRRGNLTGPGMPTNDDRTGGGVRGLPPPS
jgi:hypothetical protein